LWIKVKADFLSSTFEQIFCEFPGICAFVGDNENLRIIQEGLSKFELNVNNA